MVTVANDLGNINAAHLDRFIPTAGCQNPSLRRIYPSDRLDRRVVLRDLHHLSCCGVKHLASYYLFPLKMLYCLPTFPNSRSYSQSVPQRTDPVPADAQHRTLIFILRLPLSCDWPLAPNLSDMTVQVIIWDNHESVHYYPSWLHSENRPEEKKLGMK